MNPICHVVSAPARPARRLRGLAVAMGLGVAVFGAPDTRASVTAVSNLLNGSQGTGGVSYVTGPDFGVDFAQSFTTGADATSLVSVTIQTANADLNGDGFSLTLFSSVGGLPGMPVATLTGTTNPDPAGLYTYTPVVSTILAGSTSYWIVAAVEKSSPDKGYRWFETIDMSESGLAGWTMGGLASRNFSGGSYGAWTGNNSAAMKAAVEVETIAVPEPCRSTLLAVALIAAAMRRRKRRGSEFQTGA